MNSEHTIADRMNKAGLPYEVSNMETPQFILNGGRSVVALWKGSVNDEHRAFVGFYTDPIQSEVVAQQARRVKGCYAAYLVTSEDVDR